MARIIIAGSDAAALGILDAEISGEGHETVWAATGQDAYEQVVSERPDALFVDVSAPVFDGYAVCEMIRDDPDLPPHFPVVLLAGEDVDERRAERIGVSAILPKQHDAYTVREMLTQLLGGDSIHDVRLTVSRVVKRPTAGNAAPAQPKG